MVQEYRLQHLNMINKDKTMKQYKLGDLVYLISPQTSLFKTRTRKFEDIYIRPLDMYKIIDKFQYILMDIEDKILNGISHLIALSKHI